MRRKILRSIAKANMRTMRVEKPNRKMRDGAWRYWAAWKPKVTARSRG